MLIVPFWLRSAARSRANRRLAIHFECGLVNCVMNIDNGAAGHVVFQVKRNCVRRSKLFDAFYFWDHAAVLMSMLLMG